jgi:hypothetical protein
VFCLRNEGDLHWDVAGTIKGRRQKEPIQYDTATQRRSEKMQQVKTYISGMFKGEARYQFLRNLKKMTKDGWHVHTITDEGVGKGQAHTGRYKVVYEK